MSLTSRKAGLSEAIRFTTLASWFASWLSMMRRSLDSILADVEMDISLAEAMQRIRPLMQPRALQRDSTRRRLLREMDHLAAILGLEDRR